MILVVWGVHNHLASEYLERHSFAGRLSEEEERFVVDMSKSLVRPRDISHTLKQRNKLNISAMRTVYNARKSLKSWNIPKDHKCNN